MCPCHHSARVDMFMAIGLSIRMDRMSEKEKVERNDDGNDDERVFRAPFDLMMSPFLLSDAHMCAFVKQKREAKC